MQTSENTRKIYLEILRIIASFFVIFNHTEDLGFLYYTDTNNIIKYVISIVLSVCCKIAVPLFFMISGALLLDKKETIKELYYKRIFKYAFILVVFSMIQYLCQLYRNPNIEFDIKEFIKGVYEGNIFGPYWFFYSYFAILVMLPFLRKMVQHMTEKEFGYLFLLQLVIVGILPIIGYIGKEHYLNLQLGILSDNIFYLVMGYYFEKVINPSCYTKKNIEKGMLAGILCITISCFMTYLEYRMGGEYTQRFYVNLLAIPTCTVFCFWKYACNHIHFGSRMTAILILCGSNALGIFLIEDILRKSFFPIYQFLSRYMDAFLACCLWVLSIWLIGNIILTGIKKIPYVDRFL